MPPKKEFKVNEYITLKLEDGKTNIYVNGKLFRQCIFLSVNFEKIKLFDDIKSVDDAVERLEEYRREEYKKEKHIKEEIVQIPSDVEFWGHSSILQVWAENAYDTRLLYKHLAFPLLKKLSEEGDPLAKKVFLSEIKKRFELGSPQVVYYLIQNGYVQFLIDNNMKLDIFHNNQELCNYLILNVYMFKVIFFPLLKKLDNLTVKSILSGFINESIKKKKYEIIFLLKTQGYDHCIPQGTIKFFKDIKSISLHHLGLEEIPDLSKFPKLKELNLGSNYITHISNLDKLKCLITLDLHSNHISEIKSLDYLINLNYLDLNSNEIEKIKGLGNLVNLETLYLTSNNYKKIKGLENLKNLKNLKLDLLKDMKIEGLHNLGKLDSLSFNIDWYSQELLEGLEYNEGIKSKNGVIYEPKKIVAYCLISMVRKSILNETKIDTLKKNFKEIIINKNYQLFYQLTLYTYKDIIDFIGTNLGNDSEINIFSFLFEVAYYFKNYKPDQFFDLVFILYKFEKSAGINRKTFLYSIFNDRDAQASLDLENFLLENTTKDFDKKFCKLYPVIQLDPSSNDCCKVVVKNKTVINLELNLGANVTAAKNITEFPEPITRLESLESLSLSCIEIKTVPKNIKNLRSLKKLKLSYSDMEYFPEEFLVLENLEKLSFEEVQIKSFPENLNQLINLKTLKITFYEYCDSFSELPSPITRLPNLKTLVIDEDCEILPEIIGDLTSLEKFVLTDYSIKSLPDTIGKLKNLKNLTLRI